LTPLVRFALVRLTPRWHTFNVSKEIEVAIQIAHYRTVDRSISLALNTTLAMVAVDGPFPTRRIWFRRSAPCHGSSGGGESRRLGTSAFPVLL
jgi:hypothetical protein